MRKLVAGTILSIVLLFIIDMVILKFFPHIKFPVVILSISFSPVVIIYVTEALDCLRDIKRKPKKVHLEATVVNEKKELTPALSIQNADKMVVAKGSRNVYSLPSRGTLYFYDAGRKFYNEMHGITNLTHDCDICVYSLTPKGEKFPKWLVVKATQAGCMDRYLDDEIGVPKRCVVMDRMDYEETGQRSLFNIIRDLTILLPQDIKKTIEFRFYEDNGLHPRRIDLNDFFSIEVDSNSAEPGEEIYLRDKEYFLNGGKETAVTESQITQTEDESKNSELYQRELYQRYQQYIKNHPYVSYTEFEKEVESSERAYFQGKTWY